VNERIDQLWGQALDAAVPETYSRLSYSQVLKVKQVFAELIVRECADIATINQHEWHSAGSYVLKHFGFEK
jgi:hypothetical protein